MMTKERSIKIVNFMTPGARVLVLGGCRINHIVTMRIMHVMYQYTVHWLLLYRGIKMLLSSSAVKWLKCCRYDIKHCLINQSIICDGWVSLKTAKLEIYIVCDFHQHSTSQCMGGDLLRTSSKSSKSKSIFNPPVSRNDQKIFMHENIQIDAKH